MEKEKVISIFFQIALIAFILIIAFIAVIIYIRNKRNRDIRQKDLMEKEYSSQLMQSQIEVQEQTFKHIGMELHDNVGQLLSSSKMLLGLTERCLENPPDTLLTATSTLGHAISELRALSRSLDKEWLEQFNFTENLKTEIARINFGNRIKATYTVTHNIQLEPGEQIILFRIVQEAIQNAVKHAAPTIISITVCAEGSQLTISISDNGRGFGISDVNKGLGLKNMKHRANLLGGSISWGPGAETGTTAIIMLPLKEDSL